MDRTMLVHLLGVLVVDRLMIQQNWRIVTIIFVYLLNYQRYMHYSNNNIVILFLCIVSYVLCAYCNVCGVC